MKEWEGQIEKEFTVVLYSDSKFDPKTQAPEYFYNLYLENASAKCPPGIFDSLKIPNDAQLILNKINNFIGVPEKV